MDKEKQIEKMAKDICQKEYCEFKHHGDCGKLCEAYRYAKYSYTTGYCKQDEIVEDVLKRVKEKLDTTISALFVIGEILVDESKSHISVEKALDDIRKELGGTISSKYRFEKMLKEIKREMLGEEGKEK